MTYQSAPEAPPGSYSSGPSGPRAGFWRRFAAVILDVLVLLIPDIILIVILKNGTAYQLLATVIQLAYFTYFEGGPTGATLGKRAMGIRVYDFRQGGAIGYGRGFLRQIGKYISGVVIFIGYLWMLFDREKQTWHDKIAGTVVVPTDAYR
jgi:uncharacterized RDD family membrane protein YckC